MAIGNAGRGVRRVRLRLRSCGAWCYLSREPLGWCGPYTQARAAYESARSHGALWADGETR